MSTQESPNQVSNSPETSVDNTSFFSRLREPPRLRGFEEHALAVIGLPLDAVQLLMRSKLPPSELRENNQAAAAIIKTLHDLRFWEPLVMLGLANSFKRHRQALEDDRILLQQHRPGEDRAELRKAWNAAFSLLNDALPPVSKNKQKAA